MLKLLIKSFLILIVISLTIFLFVQTSGVDDIVSETMGKDNDDDEASKVIIVDGYKAIQLDEEVIAASGLVFEEVRSLSFKAETLAYAEVIDIAPLVSLKSEYQILLAERKILQNDLHNQNKIIERAIALHKVKSLSTRDLEKNRADRDLKSFHLSAMNTQVNAFEYKVKSKWGGTLSRLIIENAKQVEFDALASHKTSLLLLSLSKNETLDHQQQSVFVSNINQRDKAISISYLQQAQHVNNPLYGESYIYVLESNKIRLGMKLFAWIEESGVNIEGLFVPESAVIWYANQPWIYLVQDDELFIRKPLSDVRKINDGWLLKDDSLIGGDLLVTKGGQTLLSEEFKWAIPDEDDD
ncbi:MAG TPA: hypothetical protein EYQ42_01115 [Thiotrichaceae bacterium]|nr:hypothetical protein [Thiotrichaceae bacterium]